MTIYERIKALRIQQGMSQYDLARKVGYEGRSAISKVENGDRDISQSMIVKYANALGVTPTYLLYGEDKEEKTPVTQESDERAAEFTKLFQLLTAEQQAIVISQIKGILSNQ